MNKRVPRFHIRQTNKLILYGLLPLLGFAVPYALGSYHRNVSGGESYHQFYTFPKGGARPVILNYGTGGWLHRLISPNSLGGSLGITNTGQPVKIRMELVGVPEDLRVHWESSHTSDFNLETRTVERVLNTGDSISVHHTFYIGAGLRHKPVAYSGGLKILDAETGKALLFIPIKILNAGGAGPAQSGEACHEF